jgi:4-carboxymuconolactone decarboxylase
MLAMCLNTFQIDLDPNRPPPYPDIRGFARIAPKSSARP